MTIEKEDKDFIEKVIETNKEGLKRLASEEDAKEKRNNSIKSKVKRALKKLRKSKEEKAEFVEIS